MGTSLRGRPAPSQAQEVHRADRFASGGPRFETARPIIEQDGPYSQFFAGFARSHKRMRRLAGRPEDIAALIVRALVAERPRARYAGPRHATIFIALKRFMPERVFDYFLSRQAGISKRRD